MSRNLLLSFVVAALAAASGTAASDQEFERVSESSPGTQVDSAAEALEPGSGPADRILVSIAQTPLRLLAGDVLGHNPQIAAAAAQARAAERRAPQVAALPDPVLAFTAFILTPETRVGPQEFAARFSQKFPWFGKLKLKEQAALYAAGAAKAEVEATRLRILTESRRLYYELGFLDAFEQVVRADRATLSHYEELARARYSSGVGLQQAVVKIQAEITKADSRILDIGDRRATLVAALNSLRDFPQDTSIPRVELPELPQVLLDLKELRSGALELRPEIAAADARIAQAQSFIDLAHKDYRPNVTVGLGYTLVGSRDDEAGRLMPPPDNGEDIFGVTAGLNLPIWRKKLAAGVEEALEREVAAKESKRNIVTQIDRALGELPQRIDFTWQQLRLFQDVLVVQAEQSLSSAEAGYSAATQDALDLLDAERFLFDARTLTERNLADYAIAIAQLEGAIAAPFPFAVSRGVND